jgi:peptidoglycan/LPS O-acetylase OafA/YrhL
MLVSTLIVIVLATISWRLVEQPALQFVHRRKRALAATQP